MDRYKYQFIVLLVALAIGGGAGYLISSSSSDKELRKVNEQYAKELKHQNKVYLTEIAKRDKEVLRLDSLSRVDSVTIQKLEYEVKQDGVRTEVRRREAAKFTKDEKVRFILDRYSTSFLLSAQDICLPDSIVGKMIDELIVKDGLEFKVIKQDSVITVLKVDLERKSTQITILKTNEEDYTKVIANLNYLLAAKEAELKDLEIVARKYKLKAKLATLGGGSIVVGIIILVIII